MYDYPDLELWENVNTFSDNVQSFIIIYLSVPLILLNLVSGVTNIVVYNRPVFQKTTIGFYSAMQAVADIAASYSIFYFYQNTLFPVALQTLIQNKLSLYFFSTLPFYSPWMSVLMALDRCLATVWFKWKIKFQQRAVRFTMVSILLIALALVNIPLIFDNYNPVDSANPSYFYVSVYPYLSIALTSTIPFLIMCISNITTVVHLKKSKKKLNINFKQKKNRENRFIVISISLNILFMFTHLPDSILQLWNPFRYGVSGINRVYEYYFVEIGRSFSVIAAYWKFLYSMTQIFIHFATNSIYRDELKQLMCSCCLRNKKGK